jgi:hypothetical protein
MAASKIIELSTERIEKSLAASLKVHKTPEKYFLLEKNSRSNPKEVIISFPASGAFKDWFSETTFGETKIDLKLFPSLRSIGNNNEPALVNKVFLQRFQDLLEKSSLKIEVFITYIHLYLTMYYDDLVMHTSLFCFLSFYCIHTLEFVGF